MLANNYNLSVIITIIIIIINFIIQDTCLVAWKLKFTTTTENINDYFIIAIILFSDYHKLKATIKSTGSNSVSEIGNADYQIGQSLLLCNYYNYNNFIIETLQLTIKSTGSQPATIRNWKPVQFGGGKNCEFGGFT